MIIIMLFRPKDMESPFGGPIRDSEGQMVSSNQMLHMFLPHLRVQAPGGPLIEQVQPLSSQRN